MIQLDILPTALAAAGVAVKPEWKLDGVDLLAVLQGRELGASARSALLASGRADGHPPGRLEAGPLRPNRGRDRQGHGSASTRGCRMNVFTISLKTRARAMILPARNHKKSRNCGRSGRRGTTTCQAVMGARQRAGGWPSARGPMTCSGRQAVRWCKAGSARLLHSSRIRSRTQLLRIHNHFPPLVKRPAPASQGGKGHVTVRWHKQDRTFRG